MSLRAVFPWLLCADDVRDDIMTETWIKTNGSRPFLKAGQLVELKQENKINGDRTFFEAGSAGEPKTRK